MTDVDAPPVDAPPTGAPASEPKPDPVPDARDGRDEAMARERRAREKAEKEAQEARDELAERERKEAEQQGEYQKLAEQERARAEQEKARADQLEQAKRDEQARVNAERSARDLKFKDTGYALYLLAQDQVDLDDPAAVKTALDGLAQARTDLVTGTAPPPSGGPAGGAKGDPPALTKEQVEAMTPRELAAIDPDVIKKALGQQ